MKNLIFLLLMFLSSWCYGQYCSATLLYKDGSKKQGHVRLPSLTNFTTKLNEDHFFKFKDLKGEKSDVLSRDIAYLILKDKKEDEHILEFITAEYKKKDKTTTFGPFWYKILRAGDMRLYTRGNYTFSGGKLMMHAWTFNFPVRRLSEEKATILKTGTYEAKVIGKDNTFIANGSEYFKDYPQLSARIKNRELKFENIHDIVQMYNDWKEQSSSPNE